MVLRGSKTCARCGAVGAAEDFARCPACLRSQICITCLKESKHADCADCDPESAEANSKRPRGVWPKGGRA